MDFFAAGGFQQLFSDLDEQQMDMQAETEMQAEWQEKHMNANIKQQNDCNFNMLNSYDDSNNSCCDNNGSSYVNNNNYDDSQSEPFDMDYEILATCNDRVTSIHLLSLNDYKMDYNVNNNENTNNNKNSNNLQLHDLQLEHCLDYLLPLAGVDDFSAETPTQLIQEVAEWETQFLDNYIEIPELVDFLPEKTPLCTDTCELFLQESTKNLRLFRAKKQRAKSSVMLVSDYVKTSSGYTCNYGSCQKIYAKPAHLKAHLRRHMGEKPYVCNWPECTWKFSRSDELARHRRSHSGIKPYKCDYCTKCFARSDHLAKHRKVHERRLLAANKAGHVGGADGALPSSVFNVRPGRKRKNQL